MPVNDCYLVLFLLVSNHDRVWLLAAKHGYLVPLCSWIVCHLVAQLLGRYHHLICQGQNFGIAYATHIKSEGFQRFSIAHELGHYFLPGHIDAVLSDMDMHESRAGFTTGNKYEMEADHLLSRGGVLKMTLI